MSEQDLRAALKRVHAELSSDQPLTAETRALLRDVLAEIEQHLEPGDDEHAEGEEGPLDNLTERLRETTQELEGRYPRLTAALEEMATVLSRMGI